PKCIPQHDVRRLPRDTRKLQQLIHRVRHFPAILLGQKLRRALNRLRLVSKKAGGVNVLLELARRDLQIVLRLLVFPKQISRNDVDAVVGRLRRQDRRYQQFKRVRVIERTLRTWISSLESPDNVARALLEFVRAFAFRHQLIPFVSTSLSSWPTPPSARRQTGPAAAVSRPSTPVSLARATPPRAARPRDTQPSSRGSPLRTTSGMQTKCTSPVRVPTAAVTNVAGHRWDNKLPKPAEASPGRYG